MQINNKPIFYIGISGVSLFVIASIIGGLLIENYSFISQLISESYAIDTEYGKLLRAFAYVPSGVLIAVFCFNSFKYFQPSKLVKTGFYGLGLFYGLATVIVAIFPCDSGCNKEFIDPSIAQIIHSLTGLLTYVFVPISILMIGIGLKRIQNHQKLSILAITCGTVSILFITLLFSDSTSTSAGFYQRIIEGIFILWIVVCAIVIKNRKQ